MQTTFYNVLCINYSFALSFLLKTHFQNGFLCGMGFWFLIFFDECEWVHPHPKTMPQDFRPTLSPHPTVQNELFLPVISTCTHYVNELSPQATLAHHCEASTLHLELSPVVRYSVHLEGLPPDHYASATIETNQYIGITRMHRHLAPFLLTSTAPNPRKPLFYLSQRFCAIPIHSPHRSTPFLFFPHKKTHEKTKTRTTKKRPGPASTCFRRVFRHGSAHIDTYRGKPVSSKENA